MNKNEIYIKSGTQYKEMTKELLAQCDLVSQITDKKIQIGIKPNLVSPSEASWGATTHPEIVAGIIEYLQENGYENIAILEGSWVGDKTKESYEVCGYQELSEKYQVPFWDMQEDKGIEYDCKGVKLNVCERVENIDFLINVPVLKGHCQTKITCALKNMKGLIPNTEKRRFHAMGLHKPIAHLNAGIHQDFIVVDNICGDLDFEDGGNPVVMNRIWAGMDPVLIDSYVHTPQFCNVGLEDFTGSYNATHYLIQKGHRHIAFASPNIKDGGVLQERFLGYKAALAEASIPFDKSIVFQQEMDIESCKLVCEDIVKHPEITGMVVSADIMAAGIMAVLRSKGIRIPDDISIVGFDDISLAQLVTPPLTTIHQDMNLKGRLAVDFMLQLLDGKPLDTRDISLPTRLIERDSVRAL